MTNNYSVGEDVDAWCSKCKMELAHTIIAIIDELPKKVKCNTCGGQHNYRLKPGKKSDGKIRKTNRKTKSSISNLEIYESHLAGFDLSRATKYKMEGSFTQDEVIDHPFFGAGIVVSVVNSKKIEILFKEGTRLLVQNH
mgnify:CR=1 FL=1